MKKRALILSALMFSPLAAETQDVQSIFESLAKPAKATITASEQEIFASRATLPAGDYELIADARQLSTFLEKLGLPGSALPLESASFVCSKGNLVPIIEYIFAIKAIQDAKNSMVQMEKLIKYREESLNDPHYIEKYGYNETVREDLIKSLQDDKERAEQNKKNAEALTQRLLSALEALPPLSIKPAYLSLRFTQPQADALMTLISAETPKIMKRINVDGTVGFELQLGDALPEEYKKLLESKIVGTPTIFFHLVNDHEFVVAVGTGTEALQKLKNNTTKMDSPHITVPSGLAAQLYIDAKLAHTLSTDIWHTGVEGMLQPNYLNSTNEEEYFINTFSSALRNIMPQLTDSVTLQLWSQDGDVHGKLSTATSNYQLGSAPLIAPQLASQSDVDLYVEISPLSQTDLGSWLDLIGCSACQTVYIFRSMEDRDLDAEENVNGIKNTMQDLRQMTLSLSGNFGIIDKAGEPIDEHYPEFKKKDSTFFAGVKDKAKLNADFQTALASFMESSHLDEEEKEGLLETLEKVSSSAPDDLEFSFRSSEKTIAIGNKAAMVESAIAAAEAAPSTPISGVRFMLRGENLSDSLPRELRERINALYIRLDSEGEKKDVYFQLDFEQ